MIFDNYKIMKEINVEAFSKEGFTFEEIQKISKSINNFNKTGVSYSHNEVKIKARNEIFSNKKVHV